MRFLFGILMGAAVVLLAGQLGGEGRWERLPEMFDRLAQAAGDALALPPRPPAAEPASGAPESEARAPGSEARLPAARAQSVPAAGAARVEPASQPIARPPDPRPVDLLEEDTQRLAAAIFEEPRAGTAPAVSAAPGVGVDIAPAPAGDSGVPGAADRPAADPAPREQPVWVPFHSEMSAQGFAQRLSESLHHPFRVQRRGPGRYQVVFAYRDEPHRERLLSDAASVTGLPL